MISSESSYDSSSDVWSEGDDDDGSTEDETRRTLLWLCQEGQLDRALGRVRGWEQRINDDDDDDDDDGDNPIIRRELFQTNADGNYALHEILMGGTTDSAASELSRLLVSRCNRYYPIDSQVMFAATPSSHGRTLLHWAAWGKADVALLQLISKANPEALCIRDDKPHGCRTPLEISERYWPEAEGTVLLQQWMARYLPYRVQRTAHLCAYRLFVTNGLTPFLGADRKKAGLSPRPWFVASIFGYALQREMMGLALRILSFVGKGAKIHGGRKRGTRRRKRSREETP